MGPNKNKSPTNTLDTPSFRGYQLVPPNETANLYCRHNEWARRTMQAMQLPRRTTLKVLISVIGALSSCQLACAQAVPVDTSTIPTLLTKVGPVQIGIRYKLSGTQTEKDVTVNTQDYKNSTTISGSSETSS